MASNLGLELNKRRFLTILEKLIACSANLQNFPPDYVPRENLAVEVVLEALDPYLLKNGGLLFVEHITDKHLPPPGRGNLIIGYIPPTRKKLEGTIAFVGSHLDVVFADPFQWTVEPFKLTENWPNDDKLYGRGTTDCLGHVALITDMFIQLAEKRPILKRSIWAVLIASEEYATEGVGIEKMHEDGKLEKFRNGPIYWIDTSDKQPCIGCATAITWSMTANGLLGHSGLPNNAINSIEFGDEACKYIQDRFYEDFPKHEQEDTYGFEIPSTMKPTQISCATGSLNQIPQWTKIEGDIRLTPFYDPQECMDKVMSYVAAINADPTILPTRGPASSYVITDPNGETVKASIDFEFVGKPMVGIACDLTSTGYKNLRDSTEEVLGSVVPYSITGSLPLVGDLKDDGFDVQLTGYADSIVYHGNDEYCKMSDMQDGMKIFSRILDKYN